MRCVRGTAKQLRRHLRALSVVEYTTIIMYLPRLLYFSNRCVYEDEKKTECVVEGGEGRVWASRAGRVGPRAGRARAFARCVRDDHLNILLL